MDDNAKTIDTTLSRLEAEQLARAFAIAVHNASVYPTAHPRSQSAAEEYLELARDRNGITLTVHDQKLECNGVRLAMEARLEWLVGRIRKATLRGIVIAQDCTSDDLLQFALSLVSSGHSSTEVQAFTWPENHPRLRVLPLVFTGTFGGTYRIGPQTPSPGDTGGPNTQLSGEHESEPSSDAEGSGDRRMEIPESGMSIATDKTDDSVLGMLDEVVDDSVCAAPTEALADQIIDSVGGILDDTEENTEENTASFETLSLSTSIAQRYFGRARMPASERNEKPTGRPEDAGIDADLDQLLLEISALPNAADPASDQEQMATCSVRGIADQLVGVYMYLYVAQPDKAARDQLAGPMRHALTAVSDNSSSILDVYLGDADFRVLSKDGDRMALLDLLGQAGKYDLIREHDYLDAELVVSGFPDCMSLAARVLGSTTAGIQILRRAATTLAQMHGMQKFVAIMHDQALQDPVVVRAFIAIGGECARAVLSDVAWGGKLEHFALLIEHFENQDLPAAERQALAVLRPKEQGAVAYLQQLFKEANSSVSKELRLRSGKLLRHSVQQARGANDQGPLIAAIEHLALVPDDKTLELLRELGSRARWGGLFDRKGQTRAKAREVLQAIEGRSS